MDCDKMNNLLPFLDDGSLKADEEKAVRAHLEECEKCRLDYDEQVEMLHRIQTAFYQSEPEYSPEFLRMVTLRIKKHRQKHVVYRTVFAVAAVVVITLGVTLYSLLPGTSINQQPAKISFDHSLTGFEDYIASRYLDTYELSDLVVNSSKTETQDDVTTYFSTYYLDVTPEDIINTLDDTELAEVLASY